MWCVEFRLPSRVPAETHPQGLLHYRHDAQHRLALVSKAAEGAEGAPARSLRAAGRASGHSLGGARKCPTSCSIKTLCQKQQGAYRDPFLAALSCHESPPLRRMLTPCKSVAEVVGALTWATCHTQSACKWGRAGAVSSKAQYAHMSLQQLPISLPDPQHPNPSAEKAAKGTRRISGRPWLSRRSSQTVRKFSAIFWSSASRPNKSTILGVLFCTFKRTATSDIFTSLLWSTAVVLEHSCLTDMSCSLHIKRGPPTPQGCEPQPP